MLISCTSVEGVHHLVSFPGMWRGKMVRWTPFFIDGLLAFQVWCCSLVWLSSYGLTNIAFRNSYIWEQNCRHCHTPLPVVFLNQLSATLSSATHLIFAVIAVLIATSVTNTTKHKYYMNTLWSPKLKPYILVPDIGQCILLHVDKVMCYLLPTNHPPSLVLLYVVYSNRTNTSH